MSDIVISRLFTELEVVGLKPRGVTGTSIDFHEPPDKGLLDLVLRLHIPKDDVENPYEEDSLITYLSTDLTLHAVDLMDRLGPESDSWRSYLKIQTDLIRDRRKSEYAHPTRGSDNLRDQYLADECTKEEWISARNEVKSRYAWPGDYR